ncbi:MAG: hypothetical protein HYS35_09795 [Betaproteobacteria bacterium]|nr:hypothetical protein [Betaproteobacteria bacterium]
MHLELVVPALFATRAAPQASLRLPALELLLARGRRADRERMALEPWLFHAFVSRERSGQDAPVPAGALSALAFGQDPGSGFWLRADPVHLRADRDRLVLVPGQALAVSGEEAGQLAGALSRHFAGDFEFHALRPDAWCVRAREEIMLDARPPIELAGADVDANLPAKRWHPLLNEIQMALDDHPVNTAREGRGDPALNSVWLWGAGRLPAAAGPWQSVSAGDPVALGLARAAGMRRRAPGAGAREWLERAPEEGRHLVVLDALRGAHALGDHEALGRCLQALEAQWFAPLLAVLRAGRVGMLTLHVPEAALSFEVVRGDLRRFWRRAQPLAAYRE